MACNVYLREELDIIPYTTEFMLSFLDSNEIYTISHGDGPTLTYCYYRKIKSVCLCALALGDHKNVSRYTSLNITIIPESFGEIDLL